MYCYASSNNWTSIWFIDSGDSVKAELREVLVILYVPGPPLKSKAGPGSLVAAKFKSTWILL